MNKPLLVVAVLVSLAACTATMPPPGGTRMTSRLAHPEHCQYVGDVRSDEGLYPRIHMLDLDQRAASSRIMQEAADLGANTVEVTSFTTGLTGANMAGKAYACADG